MCLCAVFSVRARLHAILSERVSSSPASVCYMQQHARTRVCATDDACINYQMNEYNAEVSLNHARTRCKLHLQRACGMTDGRVDMCSYLWLYRCDCARSSHHRSTNCVRAMRCAPQFGIAGGLADSRAHGSLMLWHWICHLPMSSVPSWRAPRVCRNLARARCL